MSDGIQLNMGYDGDKLAAYDNTDDSQKYQRILNEELGPVKSFLLEYLDATGDGTGSRDWSVNGSGAAVVRKFVPASNKIARIHQITLVVVATAGFDPDKFGDLAALTNGIKLIATISTTAYDLDGGYRPKTNAELAAVLPEANYMAMASKYIGVFSRKFHGHPLRLLGENGDKLELTVQDNLSTLGDSYAFVGGAWEK